MKLRSLSTRVVLTLGALLLAAGSPRMLSTSHAESVKAPTEINVGITEYQDVEASYERYEKLFQELTKAAAKAKEPVSFKFAIGNYGEVMDWYNKGEIDVAILSAMPVANFLRDAGERDKANMREAYIGDVSVTWDYSSSSRRLAIGTEKELANKDPFFYRSVCLTLASDTELRTIDDIKRLKNQIKFIFVRPFSLSGYIVPRYVLENKHRIDLAHDQMDFSYEHQKSLENMRNLREADPKKHYVAFVLDEARYEPRENDPAKVFNKIQIDDLDSEDFNIPREKVFVNYHLEKDEFEKFKNLMKKLFPKAPHTVVVDPSVAGSLPIKISLRSGITDWEKSYKASTDAIAGIALPRQLPYKSTVDKLLADFAGYVDRPKSEQVKAPRLALVLSGGGAKCSYQAGAIIEIEAKLAKINKERKDHNKQPVDIDLVVGTSGGAINALLVAAGVTKSDDPVLLRNQRANELASLWSSFKQQEFFKPSRRFNLIFGLCFGLLQAIILMVAVLIFGRQTMDWIATGTVIILIGAGEVLIAWYFGIPWSSITDKLWLQAKVLLIVIAVVWVVGQIIAALLRRMANKQRPKVAGEPNCLVDADRETPIDLEIMTHHWRWLTIVLMLAVSAFEFVIAVYRGLDTYVAGGSENHWTEHVWMLVTLVSYWSFPYPLLIALSMATIGVIVWHSFDWNRRREKLVWLMTIVLIAVTSGLVLDTMFRASAPSKAEGIERAFAERLPPLIRRTSDPGFYPSAPGANENPLESISKELMKAGALQRDLIITISRLPTDVKSLSFLKLPEKEQQEQVDLVNGLQEDLYFYFRAKPKDESAAQKDKAKLPVDRRFVPFEYNPTKLLDVVIGSSTIYPIFPSRELRKVMIANEEGTSKKEIELLKIIDGGFIHNIPIEAAGLWKASHIILIDASPLPQQTAPKDFLDNTMMAFGYLFSQAQRTDKLARGTAETFELRPTSRCEKEDVEPSCLRVEDVAEPNMDTFDFSDGLVNRAFAAGRDDVNITWRDQDADQKPQAIQNPLFIRVAGPPLFRELTSAARRERKVGRAIHGKS
jgi:predicted acylesterase/phospholipase RssA/ABC-type phosphate/phosphonate transport system substrate-binding protein